MAIVGGALMPLVQGKVIDATSDAEVQLSTDKPCAAG